MINYGVQICNPTEVDAFMSIVDQSNEIIEYITFKRGLLVIKHVAHIAFTYFHCCYEITYKKSFNCVNLIKKCITFNSTMIAFKPNNKVSTSINKDKLDFAKGIVGASNAIFMISAIFKQDTFNKIHLVLMSGKILLSLVSMIFVSFSKCLLGL
jgi:hypothetical protein